MENKQLYKKEYNKEIKQVIVADETLKIILDGDEILLESYHDSDCCEHVFADFSIVKFHEEKLKGSFMGEMLIKGVEKMGFLLCLGKEKIFIPCHNYQNGYYSDYLSLKIKDSSSAIEVNVNECVEDSNE